MARYIDADAFLRRVESMYCLGCEKRIGIKNGKKTFIYGIGGVPCRACAVDDMKDDIENAPTADVVERKHGKWVGVRMGRWIYAKCSVCGTVHDVRSSFCPNCGSYNGEEEK